MNKNNSKELNLGTLFVTVGTTEFDELVDEVCKKKTKEILHDLGIKEVIIQYGSGTAPKLSGNETLLFECYKYKNTLENDMKKADLIISHCGSGTIFECLKLKKKVIAVVNETLQGNHQFELANQMHRKNYLLQTIPEKLVSVLMDSDFSRKIENFEDIGEPKTNLFADLVYEEMGISKVE